MPDAARYPTSFRLSPDELAQIDRLGELLGGPVRPLDRSATIREAVRRALASEEKRAGRARRRTATG